MLVYTQKKISILLRKRKRQKVQHRLGRETLTSCRTIRSKLKNNSHQEYNSRLNSTLTLEINRVMSSQPIKRKFQKCSLPLPKKVSIFRHLTSNSQNLTSTSRKANKFHLIFRILSPHKLISITKKCSRVHPQTKSNPSKNNPADNNLMILSLPSPYPLIRPQPTLSIQPTQSTPPTQWTWEHFPHLVLTILLNPYRVNHKRTTHHR